MANPLLSASPDIVLVADPTPGATATTEIHYIAAGSGRPQVWERFGLQNWSRVPLVPPKIIRSDSNDPDIDGYFSKPMTAGQFYQVRLYHDPDINPNDHPDEPRSDAEITIASLLKSGRITPPIASQDRPPPGSPPATLIASKDNNQGGTWYRQTVTTTVPTHFFLQVGSERDFVLNAEGNQVLETVLLATNDGPE